MTISTSSLLSVLGSLALAFAVSGSAMAQDSTPQSDTDKTMRSDMRGMRGDGMRGKRMRDDVKGRHHMPATVTGMDADTGEVYVTSAGMSLKVHFPPAAIADLEVGDEITLHLAFSKP